MAKVHKTREFDRPADELWELIGDFHGLHRWVPGIDASEQLDGGERRKLSMGGGHIIERLLEQSERSYTYTIDEGPLPLEDYRSTLSVKPAGETRCVVDWEGTFEPAEGTPEEAAVQIVDMVYEGGLSGLSKTLSS